MARKFKKGDLVWYHEPDLSAEFHYVVHQGILCTSGEYKYGHIVEKDGFRRSAAVIYKTREEAEHAALLVVMDEVNEDLAETVVSLQTTIDLQSELLDLRKKLEKKLYDEDRMQRQ